GDRKKGALVAPFGVMSRARASFPLFPVVVPAQAGTQAFRKNWTPAFAGATAVVPVLSRGATANRRGRSRARSARLLALRLERRASVRTPEVVDERFRRRGVLRGCGYAARECGVGLQLRGQRAGDLDAGLRHDLVDEQRAEVDLAARDFLRRRGAVGGEVGLALCIVGDAELFKGVQERNSACAFLRPGERFRREHGALQRFGRAEVRLG